MRWILLVLPIAVLALVGYVAFNVSQPVISCAPVKGATSMPPAALAAAADYMQQGDYEFDRGHCDRAIAAYSRAVELDPQMAQAYNNRAYTYMVKKDYASALPDLDRAIELRPDYANALMNRGDIYNYYYRRDDARAVADYDRVLALGEAAASQRGVLCGHRLLAINHGWSAGVFIALVTQGVGAGCAAPAQ